MTLSDKTPLTPEGEHLRAVARDGNEAVEPFGYVPCARWHPGMKPGYLCLRPEGHNRKVDK